MSIAFNYMYHLNRRLHFLLISLVSFICCGGLVRRSKIIMAVKLKIGIMEAVIRINIIRVIGFVFALARRLLENSQHVLKTGG